MTFTEFYLLFTDAVRLLCVFGLGVAFGGVLAHRVRTGKWRLVP